MSVIVRQNLVDSIALELRKRIKDGSLAPGQMLPSQASLAAELGVGLSSIREALQALRMIGLIEVYPGRGSFVCENPMRILEPAERTVTRLKELHFSELLEARLAIETSLLALAAERISAEQIAGLRSAFEGMKRAMENQVEFGRHDLQFHHVIAEAAANRLLASFYHQTRELLQEVMEPFLNVPFAREASIQLHSEMVEAIENGDVTAAMATVSARKRYYNRLLATQYGMSSDDESMAAHEAVEKEGLSEGDS